MSSQKVVNNPLGSYPVLVDRNVDGEDMQVMRIDIGVGTAESRVSSANSFPIVITANSTGWRINENHVSAQTNNELKAAPGAGLCLYVTDIIMSNGATAGTIKLVEDVGGTPVDLLGPLYFGINSGSSKKFETPLKITANKSLGFTSTVVTTHTVYVAGYIAP